MSAVWASVSLIGERRAADPALADQRLNRLLAALPEADGERWSAHLEPVELRLGQVLIEPGGDFGSVFFPTGAVVSLMQGLSSGAAAEVAVVGCEGMVGISLLLGGGSTTSRAVVQSAGRAYRMRGHVIRAEWARGGAAMRLLLRYSQALMAQMAQTAACNRHHCLDQQLCRWLLLRLDCVAGREILMTHELLASLLGVRRESVTECASSLQRAGLIRYSRGRITVLDRAGLEQRSCECYAVIRDEYERLLPAAPAC